VFVFFGLVATVGSTYVHLERVALAPVLAAVPVGLLAVAILVANNLRDIPTDAAAGKRTLAVRLGDRRTRSLYANLLTVVPVFLVIVAVAVGSAWPLLGAVALPLTVRPLRAVSRGASGRALIPVLGATAALQLATGAGLAAGLVLA